MTGISLTGLTKTYPGATRPAVDNVSLQLSPGSLTALLGPSGCGKSTTLALVAGLLAPDSGDITLDGTSLRGAPPERRPFAMVFQRPLLFPHLNVGDNVAFGLRMHRVRRPLRASRVRELLELVQLGGFEHRRVHELSGGQEQRVALARALATQPSLLLLDEPFSALDAALRAEMRELLLTVRRELGMTTLLVTHDQAEAVELADRIALLLDGRIVQHDVPRAFYEQPTHVEAAAFFGATNLLAGDVRDQGFDCALGRFAFHGQVCDGPGTLVVRPERLRLVEGARANVVAGTVVSARFRGDHIDVVVDVTTTSLLVRVPSTARVPVGARIGVELPPDGCTVIPTRR